MTKTDIQYLLIFVKPQKIRLLIKVKHFVSNKYKARYDQSI